MLIVTYPPKSTMFLIEEFFKERTYTNIFRQLSLYDFWNNKEGSCEVAPVNFGMLEAKGICMTIMKPGATIKERELIFNLEAQNFASLRDNLKRKYEKVKFARWYA